MLVSHVEFILWISYFLTFKCAVQLFEKVEVDKPQASRAASAEIYVLGFRYKAPAKIDPRLLDVKHLFQGGKELPKVNYCLSHSCPFLFGRSCKMVLYVVNTGG